MVQTTMTRLEPSLPRAEFHDPARTRDFMLAGNAYVTFQSRKTGTRFTYHVEQAEPRSGGRTRGGTWVDERPAPHFVSVLVGPDNSRNCRFLGTIFEGRKYVHGKKSTIDWRAESAVAFRWIWQRLMRDEMHPLLGVWHEGRCGKCGRRLTTPESIATGLGPTCARRAA